MTGFLFLTAGIQAGPPRFRFALHFRQNRYILSFVRIQTDIGRAAGSGPELVPPSHDRQGTYIAANQSLSVVARDARSFRHQHPELDRNAFAMGLVRS